MIDIEELKAIVREPQVMPFVADHAVVKLLHNLPNIIAELESLRKQVARKPDARRLAEVIVDKSHNWIDLSLNGMEDAITSIIERELGK